MWPCHTYYPRLRQDRGADLQLLQLGTPARVGRRIAQGSFRYNSLGFPVEERCDEHPIERSYDKHGLIVSLWSSLGAQLTYERNAYGELVCFRAGEAETNVSFTSKHQYDSLGFELEHLLLGGVSQSFVPLALIQEGKAYSIVCDQLGTPTEAYDEEGKEVWYRRLDMNGKILEETQPGLNPEGYVSIPFLFQGQYYGYETGLAYNRFRYYDPELGRYISEDPIGLASGVLAFYSYVQNPLVWGIFGA